MSKFRWKTVVPPNIAQLNMRKIGILSGVWVYLHRQLIYIYMLLCLTTADHSCNSFIRIIVHALGPEIFSL